MAVSDAKKKANAKWDSENMATLACKVKKRQADMFKAYCADTGNTSNAVLRDYVLRCIGEAMGEVPPETGTNAAKVGDIKTAQNVAGALQGTEGAILTPETLKTAQEAAQNAEEAVSAFIGRAVDTQAQRDKIMQAMRQKEKTPDESEA